MTDTYQRLASLDKQYIWHPFTQMGDWVEEEIIIIEEGEGIYLKDIKGTTYIDGISSLWVNVHGHRKKEIDEAIRAQLRKVAHSTLLGLANIPSIELARKLVAVSPPGLHKVFYSDNGSTAVEVAVKIAYQYWQQKSPATSQKKKFVSLRNAYHGDTLGSVSIGGIELFHGIYSELLFDAIPVSAPYCYRCHRERDPSSCGLDCIKELETVLVSRGDHIAAVIVEPLVQGAAGMLVWPRGYLSRVRSLCDQYKVLLIADEVATGFGRTGTLFACEHEGVSPDIMALAKGITGGYLPLAATVTTDDIYRTFSAGYAEKKTFFHGHTYTGNPLGCAAALASLMIFRKEEVLEKLQPKIKLLSERLEDFRKLSHVGDVRQCGFMVGIELVKERMTKEPYAWEEKIGIRVIQEARKRGVIIRPLGNVVVLMPPLCSGEAELLKLLDIVHKSITIVTE